MNPTEQTFKQRAHNLVDQLPDTADWKDLAYEASVMQDIEEGLRDSESDRITDNATVRKQFGLPK
ncbi:MAG: hypothetical protein ACREVK_06390 [Gammaproteobacteria bacterium]